MHLSAYPAFHQPEELESLLYPARAKAIQIEVSASPEPVLPEEPAVRRRPRRPNSPREFKIALAEKSLEPGANVAQLAREHGINDNLLFNWRNLYKRGLLCPRSDGLLLLPSAPGETVVVAEQPALATAQSSADCSCCELEFPSGILRIRGQMTPELLRMLIGEMKTGVQ